MTTSPKYSLVEVERRWLVERSEIEPLDGRPYRQIEDHYITGTRLRLRKVTSADSEPVFKLCKKYGKGSALSEPITNLYLSASEYSALSCLPGARVRKGRYTINGGSLDVYDDPCAGLVVFEVAFDSEREAAEYRPPSFARDEVTNDSRYSGASLARQEPKPGDRHGEPGD